MTPFVDPGLATYKRGKWWLSHLKHFTRSVPYEAYRTLRYLLEKVGWQSP